MADRVEVEGARQLAATLHAAQDDLDTLDRAQEVAGRVVLNRARSRTPYLSGALSRSLVVATDGPEVRVSTGLVYAGVQHYGWAAHGITGHPYLTDALEQSTEEVVRTYAADVNRELEQVKGA